MNYILHKAKTRGNADHGWLQSRHTFSFANYYNPERMHFGVLRVLNDDTVAAGMGFGTHPHDNMEIITIPLHGSLAHKDSMGNSSVITTGEIQVMSAGTGIYHSEFNADPQIPVKLLQIWIFPNKKNVEPRYDQIKIDNLEKRNTLTQILSPNKHDDGVWIYQNAWFHLGTFDNNFETSYNLKNSGNGVYAFVVKGDFLINGHNLNERDGLGLTKIENISLKALSPDAEILIMELPLN